MILVLLREQCEKGNNYELLIPIKHLPEPHRTIAEKSHGYKPVEDCVPLITLQLPENFLELSLIQQIACYKELHPEYLETGFVILQKHFPELVGREPSFYQQFDQPYPDHTIVIELV